MSPDPSLWLRMTSRSNPRFPNKRAENRRINLRIAAETNNGRIARAIADWVFDGLNGKLASIKWAMIAKCSQDTAQRDIQGLIDQGVLVKDPAGGLSTSYSLLDR